MEPQITQWDEQFHALHQRITGRFERVEPRRQALTYLQGLISSCERKNGWQLAEHAGDSCPDGVQRLLNQARWSADEVRDDLQVYVQELLGAEEGVLDVEVLVVRTRPAALAARTYQP